MSARILPLTVLAIILLLLGSAVVATAQVAGPIAAQVSPFIQPQPLPPFTLTPEEEAPLDRLLMDWQTKSGSVKTFEATFVRWDYDGVFGDGNTPKRKIDGVLKYANPDKGYYALSDETEKWICTGTNVYEFKGDLKQVREYTLPPEMQGKAIADGPMPFVFGVEAAKMKARYWMRITTPTEGPAAKEAAEKRQVWLVAYPKQAKDAANFTKVDIILTFVVENGAVVKLEPYAINITLPNQKDRTAYVFTNMETNTWLNNLGEFFKVFIRPATPIGWQHVVMDDKQLPGDARDPAAAPAANIGTAPAATVPR